MTTTPTAPTTARPSASPPGFGASTWLVAEREVMSKLRSKAFLVSTAVTVAVALAAIVIGALMSQRDSSISVALTPGTAELVAGVDGIEAMEAADQAQAVELIRSGEVEAALIPDDSETNPSGVTILAERADPSELVGLLSVSPPVELIDPNAVHPGVLAAVSLGFGLVFLMGALGFGVTIAQSVVEEKQTRIVEILISAIPTRALLAGKVLGNTLLAIGQIIALAAVSVIGLTVTDQAPLLAGLGTPLVWFTFFFALGFLLLAALYAAAGAMVSRQEDIGSTTTPLMMLVMVPYFLVVFFNDNPLVLAVMSYVPFSAAVGMPVRLFTGDALWWEPLLSLLLLAVTALAAIVLAAKIYDNSILRMGSRVTLKDALSRQR